MSPFFSIVIPLYNKGPHVERCLRSVERQTFSDFELIVVDDASTDDGVVRVKACALPGLRILERDRPGPGGNAARNLAIAHARADWVCFFDADDEWLPGHLAELARLIRECPRADVVANRFLMSADGDFETKEALRAEPGPKHRGPKEPGSHEPGRATQGDLRVYDLPSYLAIHASGSNLLHVSSVAARRSAIRAIDGFPEPSASCQRAGDGYTWLRLMLNDGLLAMSSSPGGIYHQDAVNMVTRKRYYEWWANCLITCLDELVESGKGGRDTTLLRQYRNHRIIATIFQKLGPGDATWQDLRVVWRYRQINARIPLIVIGVVWPALGRFLFRFKGHRQRLSRTGR